MFGLSQTIANEIVASISSRCQQPPKAPPNNIEHYTEENGNVYRHIDNT